MNSKGQVLVIFVLILPILFLIIALVVDLGNLETTKQKYTNEIKSTITYGLKNIEDENIESKMQTMLDANIKGEKTVTIDNQVIKINVTSKYDSIFNNIIKNKYDINLTYNGYINDNKIVIIKE